MSIPLPARPTRVFICVIALLLPISAAKAVEAIEPPPATWLENSWGVSLTGDYFQTDTNYDLSRGTQTAIGGGNYLHTFTSHLRGRYGLTHQFGLFFGAGLAQTALHDPAGDRSASNLTDLSVGADLLITKRFVNLILEAQGGYPVDYVDPMQTKPLTSDGVPFGRIGLFALKPLRHLNLSGYIGLDYPTVNLSKKFLYQVNAEIPLGLFLVGGGIDGAESIIDDGQTLLDRQNTEARATAGSERFYAYNPGLFEARAWIGFRPDAHWSFRVGYGRTLNGVRTASGSAILFSLSFNAQDLFGPSVDELEEEARGDVGSRGFKPAVEATDPSLFRDDPEPVRKKVRRPPARSRGTTPAPKDSLDQTERILDQKH